MFSPSTTLTQAIFNPGAPDIGTARLKARDDEK
jgi:hypothetical protein